MSQAGGAIPERTVKHKLGEIEVDLSATEVVLTRRDGTALRVPMPRPVSAEQAKAKFSRKQQRLTGLEEAMEREVSLQVEVGLEIQTASGAVNE